MRSLYRISKVAHAQTEWVPFCRPGGDILNVDFRDPPPHHDASLSLRVHMGETTHKATSSFQTGSPGPGFPNQLPCPSSAFGVWAPLAAPSSLFPFPLPIASAKALLIVPTPNPLVDLVRLA